MLVLARKVGERLFIGSEIVITVTKIGYNKVGLGMDAPESCAIQRQELLPKAGGETDAKPLVPIEVANKETIT